MIEETVGFLDIILREGQHTVNNVVAGYKITGVLTPSKVANRENKLPIFFFFIWFFFYNGTRVLVYVTAFKFIWRFFN